MKMVPISFEINYNDETECHLGFAPYTTENGIRVLSRKVTITPKICSGCFALQVVVTQEVIPMKGGMRLTEKLIDRWIYDRPLSEEDIKPTAEQANLIMVLGTGDIRGNYAERITHSLYIDLVVLNPKFGLEKYLPDVVKWWKDHYEKYQFKVQSQ